MVAVYEVKKLNTLRDNLLSLVIADQKSKGNDEFPKVEDLVARDIERKTIYNFLAKKCDEQKFESHYQKAFQDFLGDLVCANQLKLKTLQSNNFRTNVTENALKAFCKIAGMKYEDLLAKNIKEEENYGFLGQLFEKYKKQARNSYDLFMSEEEFYNNHLGVYYWFFLSPDILDKTVVAKPIVIYPNHQTKILEVREGNEDSDYTYAGFAMFIEKSMLILNLSNYNAKKECFEPINEPNLVYVKLNELKRADIQVLKAICSCKDTSNQPFAFRAVLYKTCIDKYEMKNLPSTEFLLEEIPTWCEKYHSIFKEKKLEKDIENIVNYLDSSSVLKCMPLEAYQHNLFDLLKEKDRVEKLFAETYKEKANSVDFAKETANKIVQNFLNSENANTSKPVNLLQELTNYLGYEVPKKDIQNSYTGLYINFFKCQVANKDHIGFNIVELDEAQNLVSKTKRAGREADYQGIWLPITEEQEVKQGHITEQIIINRGVLLYTYYTIKQKIILGVGHYSIIKPLEANKDVLVGYYAGESVMTNLFGGCDVFIKIEKYNPNKFLAKELSCEKIASYSYFAQLISTFENSLQENTALDFSVDFFLEMYHKI